MGEPLDGFEQTERMLKEKKEIDPLVVCKKVSVDGLDAVIGHYVEQGYEVKSVVGAVYETQHMMTMSTAMTKGQETLTQVLVVLVKKDQVEMKTIHPDALQLIEEWDQVTGRKKFALEKQGK